MRFPISSPPPFQDSLSSSSLSLFLSSVSYTLLSPISLESYCLFYIVLLAVVCLDVFTDLDFVSMLLCVCFVVLWPLFAFEKKHPYNLIILSLFTLSISFAVGLCCSFSKGTDFTPMDTEIESVLHPNLLVLVLFLKNHHKKFRFLVLNSTGKKMILASAKNQKQESQSY